MIKANSGLVLSVPKQSRGFSVTQAFPILTVFSPDVDIILILPEGLRTLNFIVALYSYVEFVLFSTQKTNF